MVAQHAVRRSAPGEGEHPTPQQRRVDTEGGLFLGRTALRAPADVDSHQESLAAHVADPLAVARHRTKLRKEEVTELRTTGRQLLLVELVQHGVADRAGD